MEISDLVKKINPESTILFFGAGSSISSGAPSVQKIIDTFSSKFSIDSSDYSLTEFSSIIEQNFSRKEMISALRPLFNRCQPTGSILNLPLYDWKNIYTTNYDELIEAAYKTKDKNITVYTSNFDFKVQAAPISTRLFKLHGTIHNDISDGHNSRIIISQEDYDLTGEYREHLYSTLTTDLATSNLLIAGYSLSDAHIKELIDKIIDLNSKSENSASIYLLSYVRDESRASLLERRGIKVAFGGIDDLFIELQKYHAPKPTTFLSSDDPLDKSSDLRPVTIDVTHEKKVNSKNVSAMFNGWPASYSDIDANLTFDRTISSNIENVLDLDEQLAIVLLGASGTGKTTLAKKVINSQHHAGKLCWEHKTEHTLLSKEWSEVAKTLKEKGQEGVLMIDNAHEHIHEINHLVDFLVRNELISLKLILISARNQWFPRVKTPHLFKKATTFVLKTLDTAEIESLLNLVDSNPDLKPLVENNFSGFSRVERKRRLTIRCESDPFVCLKNIFASEKFDDIILREYASLNKNNREIYRLVSAMESSGIIVHRQLIVRLLGIPAQNITTTLTNLTDIIHEFEINSRDGIYGWKGRHNVITDIISDYKMTDINEYFQLFENVIENITPTYDVEIRTIRQLCGFEKGISRIPDKHRRNILLRKMISIAPGERVPRHRLIRNLIELNELEKADTEIRLFEKDFRPDGPVQRYKIKLLLSRAEKTSGILDEDRLAILEKAKEQSQKALTSYPDNKDIMRTYCDVGIEYFKFTKDMTVFDDALSTLEIAEDRIGDPDITNIIRLYTRRISGYEYVSDSD